MTRDERAEIERRLRALAGAPTPAPPPCPPGEILDRYRRGELAPAEAQELAFHLLACPTCTQEVLVREKVERAADRAADRFAALGHALRGRRALEGLGVVAAAAAILLFFLIGHVEREIISQATIVGERGLVRGADASIVRGEGFGIEIELQQRTNIYIVLEKPGGETEEIYPAEETDINLDKGMRSFPESGLGAWDSSSLDPGRHALWVISLHMPRRSSVDQAERILAGVVREAAKAGTPEAELIRKAHDALRGYVAEVHRVPLRIEK